MSQVIEVDFKNKKRIRDFIKYDWTCSSCHTKFLYDTRDDNRVTRATIKNGKSTVNICQHCISAFHTTLGGSSAEV